jgi:23S rRNA (uracil1939-C5)-methyltransferase
MKVDIKRLGVNGEGIGFYYKKPVFVDRTMPEETVTVKPILETNTYIKAELITIERKSPDRLIPFCKYFEMCGGCDTQHMKYSSQLHYKKEHLVQSLFKYMDKKLDDRLIDDMVGSRKESSYRNKAQLPIREVKNEARFGLFRRNSNQVLTIHSCPVQHPLINKVMSQAVELMDKHHIKAYLPAKKTGLIKGLMVRVGQDTDEIQMVFVLTKKDPLSILVRELLKLNADIVSIYTTIDTDPKNQTYVNETTTCIYGKETILTKLAGFSYELYPQSFFQLNSGVAVDFYEKMLELAKLKQTDMIVDCYAGLATISHMASRFVKKGIAIEINPKAAENARVSLTSNNISNIKVITGDAFSVLKQMKENIDVIFFDPPRTGLGDQMLFLLTKVRPKKIIYGSCNPSTLAKDLNQLSKLYDIKKVIPFDMFPQTAQVESVTLLSLKTS